MKAVAYRYGKYEKYPIQFLTSVFLHKMANRFRISSITCGSNVLEGLRV